MNKTKIISALLGAAMLVSLVSCSDGVDGVDDGENTDDSGAEVLDFDVNEMSELNGTWKNAHGDRVYFDAEGGFYAFSNFAGRTGRGLFESVNGVPMIEYDGFMYSFFFRGDTLHFVQSGAGGEAESLHEFEFLYDDTVDVVEYAPDNYDGLWQNAKGETLLFDSSLMQYIACSRESLGSGTLFDAENGKGLYLYTGGRAYFCPSPDGNSFTLWFSDGSETELRGVFYRGGNVSAYADLSADGAGFTTFSYTDGTPDEIWYNDGVNYFYVGEADEYTIRDGRAYDSDGNMFGAGWDDGVYDPSEDWGDSWSENWDYPDEQ